MEKREKSVDLYRGFLILLVVVGHYQRDIVHDVIFLFHMPLFFMISGMLLQKENLLSKKYLKGKIQNLMLPYMVYVFIDFALFKQSYDFISAAKILWGGRALAGTYWYITCFIGTLFLFSFLIRHFSDKTIKCLIFMGGSIAIIESHLSEYIGLLEKPGIPWNLDVVLLAVVYLAIGFYSKEYIEKWVKEHNKVFDIIALIVSMILVAFCFFNYWGGKTVYYFDMKPLYYKELFSAILIPCAFGIVLCRIVHWLGRIQALGWLKNGFVFLDRMTLPIMFMHMPLNEWKVQLGYGRLVYVLIGIGIPVIFTVAFYRVKIMRKLFGLPNLSKFTKIEL